MSKLWGPLGWMTLHSISFIYPVNPSPAERVIASRFLDLFQDTITCNQCKTHFISMHSLYKAMHPEYLNSRQDFALFIFRAHNTVNRRLDKPVPNTVSQCIQTLQMATTQTSFAQFRQAYLSYLTRNWGRDLTGEGRMHMGTVKEMIQINNEYWSPRDIPIPELAEADVVTMIERRNLRIGPTGSVVSAVVGFRNGKLKLR
jgi:hypothetical protein